MRISYHLNGELSGDTGSIVVGLLTCGARPVTTITIYLMLQTLAGKLPMELWKWIGMIELFYLEGAHVRKVVVQDGAQVVC